jgi:Flp pilus assembly protein TadD
MAPRIAKRVLLIGWDAADWQVIHPLLDAGAMPALEGVINSGGMGNLASLQPLLSPMLWNSIATGKRPPKHGITGFVEPQPGGGGVQPVTSTSRRCKALWNICTQQGLKSHVLGWFASHPAEPIDGVCVTNQYARGSAAARDRASWRMPAETVHPERLTQKLAELRVLPSELRAEHLQPFIPRAAEIDQSDPRQQHLLQTLARLLAECASTHAAGTWLLANEPWDFAAIYYDAIDHFSHAFMRFHPPRLESVAEKDFEIYQGVVAGIYRLHDMMLARLLELAGEDTAVLIVSDHGFYSNHLRPRAIPDRPAGPTIWHRPHGILALRGPGIRADEQLFGASILDIAPTVLHFLGLPVGQDMDGKVLTAAFEHPAPVESIPSWEAIPGECGMHSPERRQDPLEAREALRQLVDLGYIEAPDADMEKAMRRAEDELRWNLALSLMDGEQTGEAMPLLKRLVAARPDEKRFRLSLAECCLMTGRPADCYAALVHLYGDAQENPPPQADLLLGIALFAEGRSAEALHRLLRAERSAPRLPRLHNHLGAVYLKRRLWREAERAFRRALEIDQDSPAAYTGLSAAARRQGRLREAAEHALQAVGLHYFSPHAHLQLGLALARLGDLKRAAQALETCLGMRPQMTGARRVLARIQSRLQAQGEAKAAKWPN